MFSSSSRLGLGSIAKVEKCGYCGEEFYVGHWDRTDGGGEFVVDVKEERAVQQHKCTAIRWHGGR